MNRLTAKRIHEFTNITFWAEKPGWDTGNAVLNLACRGLCRLPFSVHEVQKRLFYNTNRVLAVSGETVVATNGSSLVDKFMFRYPPRLSLLEFNNRVEHEVGLVTSFLASIALPTQVSIKDADIFRRARSSVPAVTQTQFRLNLDTHPPFNLDEVKAEKPSIATDNTARDLEQLVTGVQSLAAEYGYYPDLAQSSGNLRRAAATGSLTLIDVMPVYADGGRLIGDRATIMPSVLGHLAEYEAFVGQYGA